MKKIIHLLFFLLLFFQVVFAQNTSERKVLLFEPHQLNQIKFDLPDQNIFKAVCMGEILLENIDPFLAYSIVWYADSWTQDNQLKASFFDGTATSQPINIRLDSHATPREDQYISQLYFTEKNVEKIKLQYVGSTELKRIEIHFFNPGKTENPAPPIIDNGNRVACPCPQPDYLDRLGWCPDGTCPVDATPDFTEVTHLIVHHSAGSNSSSDWAATVRSIYDYHVFTRGWDDIGYNWLIDPNGVIYQGRGDNVRGAHFCGNNSNTMGVCVMGDFTDLVPTDDAIGSLESLLAWKVCDVGIEANDHAFHSSSGLELQHISGHRDGCPTACPGDSFYPLLSVVREDVQFKLDHECNDLFIAPPTDLEATFDLDNNILLTWIDHADNETGYQIERSLNYNNNFSVIANLPANEVAFVDDAFSSTTPYYYKVKATLGDSSSTYSNKVFIEPLTGISSLLNENTVEVFPNPTFGKLQVVVKNGLFGKLEISALDVLGRAIQSKSTYDKNTNSITIDFDLSGFPSGVYFMKLTQGGDTGIFQILKN